MFNRTYAGPTPPRSWTKKSEDLESTAAWRRQALSISLNPLPHLESFPPLTVLCLRFLASYPDQDFTEDIVQWIPLHLRRELVRDAALHDPVNQTKLFSLYKDQGHAAGEIVVIGPRASLPESYFLQSTLAGSNDLKDDINPGSLEGVKENWDAEDSSPEPLTTLAIVSTPLNTSTILSLPPSLTTLALINLQYSVPLHRLPSTCPLLVVLDLSYNPWLTDEGPHNALERIDWKKWNALRTLGIRSCHINQSTLTKINNCRWDEVEIIQ
jgi:hypothetical protein